MEPSAFYGIMNISFFILLVILLFYANASSSIKKNVDKVYRDLILWVMFFCILDALWGFFNSKTINVTPRFFFIFSSLLHFANVCSAFFWIQYYIAFVGYDRKHKIAFLTLGCSLLFTELVFLLINVYKPIFFRVNPTTGAYTPEKYRFLSFIIQYSGYLIVAISSIYGIIKHSKENRGKYVAVCISTLAPLLFAIGKFFDANVPFNSMAYMFGCFIIHIFVSIKDHEESILLISKTDELTGIANRRSYDEELKNYETKVPDNMVVISADLNELKYANDNFGHSAGDELIIGAKDILCKVFGSSGKIFRTGGDEFMGLISLDTPIENLLSAFDYEIKSWKGKENKKISLSIGYAAKKTYPEMNINQLCKLADEQMYANKTDYYLKNKIERRGQ